MSVEISIDIVDEVFGGDALQTLIDDAKSAGAAVESTTAQMKSDWAGLEEVFDVAGANGAWDMMVSPAADGVDFATATQDLYWAVVFFVPQLDGLKKRRDDLLERIKTYNHVPLMNRRQAEDILQSADLSAFDRWSWQSKLTEYENQEESIRSDAASLHSDIVDIEGQLSRAIDYVTGGEHVKDADGAEATKTTNSWSSDGANFYGPLGQRFQADLSSAVAERIKLLSGKSEQEVRVWIAENPEFMQAVALLDSYQASRLFEGLSVDSTPILDGENVVGWSDGPLALLFAAAPGVVGNLNGIPTAVKNSFNREQLRQIVNSGGAPPDEIAALNKALVSGETSLLSLVIDSNGELRAAVASGDVDRADLVVTLTHGISTDVSNIGPWMATSEAIRSKTQFEASMRGSPSSVATIVYFSWDSGDTSNVADMRRPTGGAILLSNLMEGVKRVNPEALTAGWFHSLGTTMGSEVIRFDYDAYDLRYYAGSAGVVTSTSQLLADSIGAHDSTLFAASAGGDWVSPGNGDAVAPAGRGTGWGAPVAEILSGQATEHPVDPRTIPGAVVVNSEAHTIATDGGSSWQGARTPGHDAHGHTEAKGAKGRVGHPYPATAGYFDQRSATFLEGIDQLADLLVTSKKNG